MATKQSTADYLVDQVSGAGDVRVRKMFGEYALYLNDKVVALICDDQFFLKPTKSGEELLGTVEEGEPYPGSKPYFRISEELWEDRELLTNLILCTYEELPEKKKKSR